MSRVDRTGAFRAKPTEWGVDVTPNNFPTFNVQAKLVEYYDGESGEWIAWEDYEQEVTCYLCLFGYKKGTKDLNPTANHGQVMKVFGWNGESFAELAGGNYNELVFQVKIEDNVPEYADKNPFVVNWIDEADANPVRQLKKLDAGELKDLDKQFGALLKKTGKPKAAASAPKTPPKTPPKTKTDGVEETPVPDSPEEKKRKLLEKSKKNLKRAKTEPAPPSRKSSPKPPPSPADIKGTSSKSDAWATIVELKRDDVTDEQLGQIWNDAIDEVAGEGVDNKDVTSEQWFDIQEKVLDQVAKF